MYVQDEFRRRLHLANVDLTDAGDCKRAGYPDSELLCLESRAEILANLAELAEELRAEAAEKRAEIVKLEALRATNVDTWVARELAKQAERFASLSVEEVEEHEPLTEDEFRAVALNALAGRKNLIAIRLEEEAVESERMAGVCDSFAVVP